MEEFLVWEGISRNTLKITCRAVYQRAQAAISGWHPAVPPPPPLEPPWFLSLHESSVSLSFQKKSYISKESPAGMHQQGSKTVAGEEIHSVV